MKNIQKQNKVKKVVKIKSKDVIPRKEIEISDKKNKMNQKYISLLSQQSNIISSSDDSSSNNSQTNSNSYDSISYDSQDISHSESEDALDDALNNNSYGRTLHDLRKLNIFEKSNQSYRESASMTYPNLILTETDADLDQHEVIENVTKSLEYLEKIDKFTSNIITKKKYGKI